MEDEIAEIKSGDLCVYKWKDFPVPGLYYVTFEDGAFYLKRCRDVGGKPITFIEVMRFLCK